jgi:hypothetical protein
VNKREILSMINEEYINENECNCEDCHCEEPSESEKGYTSWDLMVPVVLDTENLGEIELDNNEFQRGVDSVSYVAGQITALLNCGLDLETAVGYIINAETIKHNQAMAQIEKEKNIEITKNNAIKEELTNL